MKKLLGLVCLGSLFLSVSAFAFSDRTTVEDGSSNGYATAYCPRDYRLERCDFDYSNCDGQQQGYDYCRADSRDHRYCRVRANCVSNPRTVEVRASTSRGSTRAYCPGGFYTQSCRFDSFSCDNTRQSNNYCEADSRDNRYCQFTAICRDY